MSAYRTDLTGKDFYHTLNGFDEIAVAQAFGRKPIAMSQSGDEESFGRSLLFTLARREGLSDTDAYAVAMNATVAELKDSFADEDDEPMEDEPVTDAGKGLSEHGETTSD